MLDSRPKGRGFEAHWRHCVVSLSKNINPSLVLVLPMKTRPYITEGLLMGRKESNQTNKQSTANLSKLQPVPTLGIMLLVYLMYQFIMILLDFLLIVKAATLIFISGRGLAISSA